MQDFDRILTFIQEGRQLYHKTGFPIPRFISCWPTEVCNLDCSYCFFTDTNRDPKSQKFIDADLFLKFMEDAHAQGVEALEFSGGGEPALHPEFKDIISRAHDIGLHLGMLTNGTVDMPNELISQKMKYVRVGLDAATPETYDKIKNPARKDYWFQKAIVNIRSLVHLRNEKPGHDFIVGIKCILNTINSHELSQIIGLARKLEVDYIQFKAEHSSNNAIPVHELGVLEAVIKDAEWNGRTRITGSVIRHKASVKCFMSPIHAVVRANGDVLMCCYFQDRPVGHISRPIREFWGSDTHKAIIDKTQLSECVKIDCRWHSYNSRMRGIVEDPLCRVDFI